MPTAPPSPAPTMVRPAAVPPLTAGCLLRLAAHSRALAGARTSTHPPTCPRPTPDFGQAPMLITACKKGKIACKQLLVVGQKAGIVWALRPDTGAVDWW